MITPDVSLGQILMIGVTLALAGVGALGGYFMLRSQSKATADRLSEHTVSVKESVDKLGARVGSVESDVQKLRLEIAKEYVSADKLRETEGRINQRMDTLDHQVRQIPQQVVGLLNAGTGQARRSRTGQP
ncbi:MULTISPECIES: hypothetical protein [unclassified Methylobacterium]|uniref:hypothetical protein n=1 Tax=unclassified Methylobacterium TaxID=2615210 RepID=UPI000CC9A70B|nr:MULTISPECIES: hypothetical protein [unclassified Methylobacterium]PIU06648.1 MAG: hypothetical protein COT56_08425 [Methylobacterium sp. CG09_land_8_20_14_0_10_71_15]PIU12092.1 MAG: hypothetical protein COT28_16820 [Methylobacterium sp. CG08_land_8_20_14_0_20_71_15]GBU19672.1 hypothetical protein AwMethylo_38870 [Methylobacterium sp.]